ncbi:hypothetical protein B0T14DRAFT_281888 [Immersiella caudata]|uniref:NACHT domain-containing protein n=1 Tax=Immersiella caudata TaxID=314043 RepID=A0AA40BTZ3_9PEZI|nr:hypothetical protein B0T14DRAFT_281888 [Immersiella caudata]
MCEYLIALVSFFGKIISALGRKTMLQLASPFIGFFDKEAKEFENELLNWSNAIDRRAMVLLSRRQLDAADMITKIDRALTHLGLSQKQKQNDLVLQSCRLQDRLCARQFERAKAWRRQRRKGTAKWVFTHDAYKAWKDSMEPTMLWIHGKLGSGKTVLIATIVAELQSVPAKTADMQDGARNITAYVFCKNDHPGSNTYEDIMGSVLQQIVSQLEPGCLFVSQLEDHLKLWDSAPDADALDILGHSLPSETPIYILLDALDECESSVGGETLIALNRFAMSRLVRVCCSTRTGAPVSKRLHPLFPFRKFEIRMGTPAMIADMKEFVEAEFERHRHLRDLDVSTEKMLKDVLVGAADGMYLWLALQIHVLFPHDGTLISASDITQFLQNLPKGLWDALDRALDRVPDARYGKRIFQLIMAARRPLTIDELRIALHVEPGNTNWDTSSLPKDKWAIVPLCGGGLLDIDEEDNTVQFIHHSIYQYFIDGAKTVEAEDQARKGAHSRYFLKERRNCILDWFASHTCRTACSKVP